MNWKNTLLALACLALVFSCSDKQQELLEIKIKHFEMKTTIGNQNKTSVRAFFQALENEDVDQLVALFAEDARHINPYASGLFPEGAEGKEAIRD